uniref:class A sortase n=1 Tax=Lentilactobacillus hilgardii TaxID=1588 RepID=UPI00403F0AB7
MRKYLAWSLVIIVFLLGGISVFINPIENFAIHQMTNQSLHLKIQSLHSNHHANNPTFDFKKVKPVNITIVRKSLFKTGSAGLIGKIAIPAVNLKLPIYNGINNTNLLKGAGTMKSNEKMGTGNYALAGHHMANPHILFSPLINVRRGEKILLTNGKTCYIYKIRLKKVINKYQIGFINTIHHKKLITLITCSSPKAGETNRILIQGRLVDKAPITSQQQRIFN